MLSTYALKNNKFLVVDSVTNGILTLCNSVSLSNAICYTIPNAELMIIESTNAEILNLIGMHEKFNEDANFILVKAHNSLMPSSTANLGKIVKTTKGPGIYGIEEMDLDDITPEWIEARHFAFKLRYEYRINETKLIADSAQDKRFMGDAIFLPFIKRELEKCDYKNDEYTDIIKDWAKIRGVDIKTAFGMLATEVKEELSTIREAHSTWTNKVHL
jgi:hypothetical protein